MAHRNRLDIGGAPAEEECASVGARGYDYKTRAIAECAAFIVAIRKVCGPEPEGSSVMLLIANNPHDFGTYHSVVCDYAEDDIPGMEYAWKVEAEAPATWAEAGMKAPFKYTKTGPGSWSG